MLAAIWDNKIDLIFFISIGFVIVVIALWFIFNGVYTKTKNRKAAKNLKNPNEVKQEETVVEEVKPESTEESVSEDELEKQNIILDDSDIKSTEEPTETTEEEPVVATEEIEAESAEPVEETTEVQTEEVKDEAQVEEPVAEELKPEETPVEEEPVVEENAEEVKEEEPESVEETTEETPVEEENLEQSQPEEKVEADDALVAPAVAPVVEEAPKANSTKKGRTYNGKYEVFQVADGYAYHLKASNGEILVSSETYASRDGVIKAIKAVQKNLETGEVRIFADKRGKYKFKLISKNYRVLAISSNYSVEKSAVRASESFKKFAQTADIVDIELDDTEIKTATTIKITATEDKEGGKFVIEKFDGEYSWDLKASNGQILCQAEGYTSKVGCTNSIDAFKKCVETGVFKCVKDKTGRYCYKLYTQNNRICAVGESYSSKQGAESAANSVVSFYKLASIEEIKN